MAEPVIPIVSKSSEVPALARFLKENFAPTVVLVKGQDGRTPTEILVIPEGLKAVEVKPFVDKYLVAPERRRGIAQMEDMISFIEHAKRFSDSDSALFANPDTKAPSITAVLDYHRAGPAGAPQFGEHRTKYGFPLSPQWKKWNEKNATQLGQKEFAEFLEDNLADIGDPTEASDAAINLAEKLGGSFASPSRLRDLAREFSVREGSAVKEARNLSTGEVQLSYVTAHTDESGAPLKVPSLFLIHIPVFRSEAPYEIAARLRYRINSGRVTWFFELYRTDKVFDDAFNGACKRAAAETGLPLFVGTPE
jgi:uncharacterized protein YfdQ (DUF2303 family)